MSIRKTAKTSKTRDFFQKKRIFPKFRDNETFSQKKEICRVLTRK
jgi:hypothetical protein